MGEFICLFKLKNQDIQIDLNWMLRIGYKISMGIYCEGRLGKMRSMMKVREDSYVNFILFIQYSIFIYLQYYSLYSIFCIRYCFRYLGFK